jgi:hypothetical protein
MNIAFYFTLRFNFFNNHHGRYKLERLLTTNSPKSILI